MKKWWKRALIFPAILGLVVSIFAPMISNVQSAYADAASDWCNNFRNNSSNFPRNVEWEVKDFLSGEQVKKSFTFQNKEDVWLDNCIKGYQSASNGSTFDSCFVGSIVDNAPASCALGLQAAERQYDPELAVALQPLISLYCSRYGGGSGSPSMQQDYANCRSRVINAYVTCADETRGKSGPALMESCINGKNIVTDNPPSIASIGAALQQVDTTTLETSNQVNCVNAGGEWINTENRCIPESERRAACEADDGTWEADSDGFPFCRPADVNSLSDCAITGIGWLLCPILDFLGEVADHTFSLLEGFLQVQPTMFDTSSPAYGAYAAILPIANILLVILFLVIIYSTATGNGFGALSNYSVKQILPRLIIFAILLNLSWWICAVAVDISNLLGSSMKAFFTDLAYNVPAIEVPDGPNTTTGGGFASITGLIISGALIAGGIALFSSLSIFIPLILAVLLVLLMTLLILIVRQLAVVLLVVIAPIAFAMAILPNTQSLFKKWWKVFSSLLLVYPIIGLIYGASILGGQILIAQGNDLMSKGSGTIDVTGFALMLAGSAAQILPLFAVPWILKGSLNSLGKVGAMVGGFAAGRMSSQFGRTKSKAKEEHERSLGGQMWKRHQANAQRTQAFRRAGLNKSGEQSNSWRARATRAANARLGKTGQAREAKGYELALERSTEAVKAQEALVASQLEMDMSGKGHERGTNIDPIVSLERQMREAVATGNVDRARAVQNQMVARGKRGVMALHDTLRDVEGTGGWNAVATDLRSDIQTKHYGAVKGGYASVAAWARDPNATLAEQDIGATDAAGRGGVWATLGDSEIATQNAAALVQAGTSIRDDADMGDGVTGAQWKADTAQRILDNRNLSLDEGQRAALRGWGGGAPPPAPPAPPAPGGGGG
ncbi:hypothetical protein FWG95_00580 [Candidatus Saccharibacteria bacterium]|nr:hypothetical protein [Candidatus Saccharibacteria bacterium]